MDRQMKKRTDRQADVPMNIHRNKWKSIRVDVLMHRQIDGETDRLVR